MKRTVMIAAGVFLIGTMMLGGCQDRKPKEQKYVPQPAPFISMDQIQQMEKAAKMAPDNPAGWITLGNALMDTKQFPAAVEAYQKALKLDPKNVNVRVDMGTCYRGSGQPEKAIEEYRQALKIDPNHVNANRNSGVVLLYDLRRPADAARSFEKYLQVAPGAPDAAEIRQLVADIKAGKVIQ